MDCATKSGPVEENSGFPFENESDSDDGLSETDGSMVEESISD